MRLLTKNTDLNYLREQQRLLEANGIPAVVKGEHTAGMVTPFLMTEPSLWVYLDEQWPEAEKLILDPDYEVQGGVDVEEFYHLTSDIAENPRAFYETLLPCAIGAIIFLVAVIVLLQILGS